MHRRHTRNNYRLIHDFKVSHDDRPDLSDIEKVLRKTLQDINDHDAYSRLLSDLRRASHERPERFMPNPLTMFEETGVLIGAKGWRNIATAENCMLLLSQMAVGTKYGRQRLAPRPGLPSHHIHDHDGAGN